MWRRRVQPMPLVASSKVFNVIQSMTKFKSTVHTTLSNASLDIDLYHRFGIQIQSVKQGFGNLLESH